MPESNDSPVTGRSIPASNRFASALIDMMVVALPTTVVALLLSERFSILDETSGRPRFSESDQLRINQIDEGFNRAMRLGDTVFTLSGGGWWLTVLVLVTLTAFIFVLLPSTLRRRTPGQVLLSLPTGEESDDAAENVTMKTELLNADPGGPDLLNSAALTPATLSTPALEPEPKSQLESEPEAQLEPEPDAQLEPEPEERLESATGSESRPDPDSESAQPLAPLGAEESIVTTPLSLGDPGDYVEWDRMQTAAIGTQEVTAEPRSFEKLALAESSLAESPLHASRTATAVADVAAPTAESPIWSDLWNAWLYWEPKSDRWFRHDTDSGSWKPLK